MLFILFPIFLTSILSSYCTSDIAEDLKNVLAAPGADPNCSFNYTEVTSQTIKFFPKCTSVFGIIVINENTDLSNSELQNAFQNMTSLTGGIRIENSKLTNLSIFAVDPLKQNFRVICETYGVFILNNQNLTNVDVLWTMYLIDDEFGNECDFRVENNTKLDAGRLCDYGYLYLYMDLRVIGNLKDCGCLGDEFTETSFSGYHNCTKIYRGLHFENQSGTDNLNAFSNIKTIRGGLEIHDSNFQNLSFLENLETIKTNNHGKGEKWILNIFGNPKLERLAIPFLRELYNSRADSIQLANIKENHPNFCLTIEEACFFLESKISFVNLETKICEDTRTQIFTSKICRFRSMSSLEDNCTLIIGDLIVNSGDEPYFPKLTRLRYLFGSLVIQNTSLSSTEPIQGIRYILHLNSINPVVQIVGNKILKQAFIDRIQNVITTGNRTAIFQDNHRDIFKSTGGKCDFLIN